MLGVKTGSATLKASTFLHCAIALGPGTPFLLSIPQREIVDQGIPQVSLARGSCLLGCGDPTRLLKGDSLGITIDPTHCPFLGIFGDLRLCLVLFTTHLSETLRSEQRDHLKFSWPLGDPPHEVGYCRINSAS